MFTSESGPSSLVFDDAVLHKDIHRQFGYVPFAVLDVSSTGRQTREGSRTLEVGPNDL